jgi:hypothetical protein
MINLSECTIPFTFVWWFNFIFLINLRLGLCKTDKHTNIIILHLMCHRTEIVRIIANKESQCLKILTQHSHNTRPRACTIFWNEYTYLWLHWAVLSSWASLLLCIWKVSVSNLCPETGYPHWSIFVFFLSPETVVQIKTRTAFLQPNSSLILLSFDAIIRNYWQRHIVTVNKQTNIGDWYSNISLGQSADSEHSYRILTFSVH